MAATGQGEGATPAGAQLSIAEAVPVKWPWDWVGALLVACGAFCGLKAAGFDAMLNQDALRDLLHARDCLEGRACRGLPVGAAHDLMHGTLWPRLSIAARAAGLTPVGEIVVLAVLVALAAGVLFATVARCGGWALAAVSAGAFVLLLSSTGFPDLTNAYLDYLPAALFFLAVARLTEGGDARWALLSGLCFYVCVEGNVSSLALTPVLFWSAAASPRSPRRALVFATASALLPALLSSRRAYENNFESDPVLMLSVCAAAVGAILLARVTRAWWLRQSLHDRLILTALATVAVWTVVDGWASIARGWNINRWHVICELEPLVIVVVLGSARTIAFIPRRVPRLVVAVALGLLGRLSVLPFLTPWAVAAGTALLIDFLPPESHVRRRVGDIAPVLSTVLILWGWHHWRPELPMSSLAVVALGVLAAVVLPGWGAIVGAASTIGYAALCFWPNDVLVEQEISECAVAVTIVALATLALLERRSLRLAGQFAAGVAVLLLIVRVEGDDDALSRQIQLQRLTVASAQAVGDQLRTMGQTCESIRGAEGPSMWEFEGSLLWMCLPLERLRTGATPTEQLRIIPIYGVEMVPSGLPGWRTIPLGEGRSALVSTFKPWVLPRRGHGLAERDGKELLSFELTPVWEAPAGASEAIEQGMNPFDLARLAPHYDWSRLSHGTYRYELPVEVTGADVERELDISGAGWRIESLDGVASSIDAEGLHATIRRGPVASGTIHFTRQPEPTNDRFEDEPLRLLETLPGEAAIRAWLPRYRRRAEGR